MNSFEIFDNAFQTVALLVMMVVAGGAGLKYQSRKLVVLACAYGSSMLGTLFYMLHLSIIGDIPRIFYVSEISWMAGYLFYLFLVILRAERAMPKWEPLPAAVAILVVVGAVYSEVMGNSVLMSLLFGGAAGTAVYLSGARLCETWRQGGKPAVFDGVMISVVVLQILLYFVSEYITDYSTFNLYFAVDILMTLTMCSLFWCLKKERGQR